MTAPADIGQVGRHTEPAALPRPPAPPLSPRYNEPGGAPAGPAADPVPDEQLFPPLRRDSDRLITPAVVCMVVGVAGVLVLSVVVAMVVLTLRGLDPDPMLKLTAQAGGGLAALVNLWFTVGVKATGAKTERNTGVLARRVAALEARNTETAPAGSGGVRQD